MNDMCRAVVKQMVGDIYVNASGTYGSKKVLNHLYEPVFESVQVFIIYQRIYRIYFLLYGNNVNNPDKYYFIAARITLKGFQQDTLYLLIRTMYLCTCVCWQDNKDFLTT